MFSFLLFISNTYMNTSSLNDTDTFQQMYKQKKNTLNVVAIF